MFHCHAIVQPAARSIFASSSFSSLFSFRLRSFAFAVECEFYFYFLIQQLKPSTNALIERTNNYTMWNENVTRSSDRIPNYFIPRTKCRLSLFLVDASTLWFSLFDHWTIHTTHKYLCIVPFYILSAAFTLTVNSSGQPHTHTGRGRQTLGSLLADRNRKQFASISFSILLWRPVNNKKITNKSKIHTKRTHTK